MYNQFKFNLILLISLFVIKIYCYDDWVYQTVRDAEAKNENIDECGICNLLNKSFYEGYEKTKTSELPENSEIRLIEIQEHLCEAINYGKNKCLKLAQEQEDLIEKWWSDGDRKQTLHEYLCIDKLNLCCPDGLFGSNCEKCPGFPDKICNQNGVCDGNGNKKGTGKCICNRGSEGEECNSCEKGYIKDENGICKSCDKACDKDGCSGLGADACIGGCADGFRLKNNVCVDIDECKESEEENNKEPEEDDDECGCEKCKKKSICEEDEMCFNNYGSYSCIKCDKLCKSCYGLSKDQCIECADGYIKEGKKCIPYEESTKSIRMEQFKYLFYVLISILCMLLMKSRPLVALLITIFLSIYIAFSEYVNSNSYGYMQALEELFF